MRHFASTKFWDRYEALPADIRDLADKNFLLLKSDLRHPSLHFKKLGNHWSARVGAHYRALAVEVDGGMTGFWIGTHAEYDRIAN